MQADRNRHIKRPPAYQPRAQSTPAVKETAINRLLIRIGICAFIFIGLAFCRNAGLDMSKISSAIDSEEALGYTEIMGYIGRVISPEGPKEQTEGNDSAIAGQNGEAGDFGILPQQDSLDRPIDQAMADDMPSDAVLDPLSEPTGASEPTDVDPEDSIVIETAGSASIADKANLSSYQNLTFVSNDLGSDTTDPGPFKMLAPDNVVDSKVALGFKYTTPLAGSVTSPFAYRVHPIDGQTKFHYGIDIGGSQGKAIAAFAAGRVVEAGFNVAYGNYVKIEHTGGFVTLYGHCSKLYVSKGDKVKMGEKIGAVGMTGWATGPHLHFEIRNNGKYYDPTPYIAL